ncbi:PREDICTED: plasma alpha-L-fucosidase isoform X2 [Polistes canadensis]|uniref:plasma alpha-L-fucosidase isoform X2 n=1 Tax=Polistes canadensis TaxID=91411 RepID=UPI000718DC54|nr:PREDICTED: plasma alpha-L-fucosidase isoform X2 [Polistes canadensis]
MQVLIFFCYITFLWNIVVQCGSLRDHYFVIEKSNTEEYELSSRNIGQLKYDPTWNSLDARPLPDWYDNAKFGIFIHWGVFSVPSFGSEWFWNNWKEETGTKYHDFMKQRYPPNYTYQDFAHDFTAEFFNASQWSEMFEASGAKYVVLTSKHHEGYTLWPSKYSFSWNSIDIGPQKNLIDGDWEATDSYWKSKEFLSWLYNESPVKETVVVNDRWGKNIPCHHGDFYTCTDRFNPGVLLPHKWENCMTIDKKSWGFRRNAALADYFTLNELVKELVTTVSCGGNLLMNVGPTKDGIISPIFEERLRGIGSWLKINGEAIYNTKPWKIQNDTLTSNVWYTQSKDEKRLYILILEWPKESILSLGSLQVPNNTHVSLLGFIKHLDWKQSATKFVVQLPYEAHKGEPGWVLKVEQE